MHVVIIEEPIRRRGIVFLQSLEKPGLELKYSSEIRLVVYMPCGMLKAGFGHENSAYMNLISSAKGAIFKKALAYKTEAKTFIVLFFSKRTNRAMTPEIQNPVHVGFMKYMNVREHISKLPIEKPICLTVHIIL